MIQCVAVTCKQRSRDVLVTSLHGVLHFCSYVPLWWLVVLMLAVVALSVHVASVSADDINIDNPAPRSRGCSRSTLLHWHLIPRWGESSSGPSTVRVREPGTASSSSSEKTRGLSFWLRRTD